jgi:hypothetical protein
MRVLTACAVLAWLMAACGGGGGATPSPAPGVVPLNVELGDTDLCDLLTAADFVAVGITTADAPTENNTDTEFFCVYSGASSASGGIELDAYVYDDPADVQEAYESLLPTNNTTDVTAQVPDAQAAVVGTAISGGPEFALIAVRSGNLTYGIGIPMVGDWKNQLIQLAGAFMRRAAELST